MASIGISDVVTASVYSEKTRMKKLMMKMIIIIIIIIMNTYIARINGFSRAPEIDFRYEIKARKVPEVGLVKKLTGSLYWWVEQCVPTLHRVCYHTL